MTDRAQYLLDFSLALVNRTGAYLIGRDLLEQLPEFFSDVRYWRLIRRTAIDGLARKILARAMMKDIELLRSSTFLHWPEGREFEGRRRVFLDPLYVLRAKLERGDIVLCHDVGPLTHADLFGPAISSLYREAYDKIAAIGPGMVFVSMATEAAFRETVGENFRFLQTIPLYVREAVSTGSVETVPQLTRPFVLTVGALETRKNHLRVMEAYAASGLHERGVDYVICGSRGVGRDLIIRRASETPGVRYLGFVTDAQLRWLYRNATGFVLPSLLEGVGLPAIEAAQRGLVALVSAGGAQEEAIAGAGILVDPNSSDDIRAGLIRLVDLDEPSRRALVSRVQEHANALTFDRFIESWRKLLETNEALGDRPADASSATARRP